MSLNNSEYSSTEAQPLLAGSEGPAAGGVRSSSGHRTPSPPAGPPPPASGGGATVVVGDLSPSRPRERAPTQPPTDSTHAPLVPPPATSGGAPVHRTYPVLDTEAPLISALVPIPSDLDSDRYGTTGGSGSGAVSSSPQLGPSTNGSRHTSKGNFLADNSPLRLVRSFNSKASASAAPPAIAQARLQVAQMSKRPEEHRQRAAEFEQPRRSKHQPKRGGKLLLCSRFMLGPDSFAKASNVQELHKFLTPVGAVLDEGNKRAFGQWVSTANTTYESLDYDECENIVLQEERARRKGDMQPSRVKVWLILMIVGILTGAVGFLIDRGIEQLNKLKYAATEHFLDTPSSAVPRANATAGDNTVKVALPMLIYTLISVGYVAIAVCLVVFGEPLAKGSGISEIKSYLNGIRMYRVVRIKTLFIKAVGILFTVAGGLPCGKEGPMIHSGACIGAGICAGKSSKFHFDLGFFQEFRNDREKNKFVTAGAAAGVGVAFGAPIGGVLFAVEEIGTYWSLELTVMVFVCASIGPWVLQLLMDPTNLDGAVNGLINFGSVAGNYYYRDLLLVALLGILGGLLGAVFIRLNVLITRQRRKREFMKGRLGRILEALVITAIISVALMLMITVGFTCRPVEPSMESSLRVRVKNYGCYAGEYNDMATYFFRSLEDTIHLMTHTNFPLPAEALLMHFIPFYFFTIFVYGVHVPSGLFLPSLALGAVFGRLYAMVVNHIAGSQLVEPSYYAIFGATAVLGGIVRATISVIVIVMETTANTTFFYPLAVATVFARLVGDFFTHGIYEEHLHVSHVPLLQPGVGRADMNLLCAGDIMNPDIVCVKETIPAGELAFVLMVHPFQKVLIVIADDDSCVFRGVLTRRQALVLLDRKAWERDLTHADFVKSAKEREYLKLKKYQFFEKALRPEDDDKPIVLTRYMDQWPHQFPPTTPASRLYRTVHELALQYIIIVTGDHRPVGIVSRNELCYLEMVDANDLTEDLRAKFDKDPAHHRLHYQLLATHADTGLQPDNAVQSTRRFFSNMVRSVRQLPRVVFEAQVRYGHGDYIPVHGTSPTTRLSTLEPTSGGQQRRSSASKLSTASSPRSAAAAAAAEFLEEANGAVLVDRAAQREGPASASAGTGGESASTMAADHDDDRDDGDAIVERPDPSAWRSLTDWSDTYRKRVN